VLAIGLDNGHGQAQDSRQLGLWRKPVCEDNMHDLSSRFLDENPAAIANRLIQKAHNRDGLPEIAMGITFLAAAAMEWLQLASRSGSVAYKAANWGMMLLVPAIILGSQWVIKKVRRRFLVERVGYVELKPLNRRRVAIVIAIAFVMATAAVLAAIRFRDSSPPTAWFLAGTGMGGGVLMVLVGRLPRLVVGGALMAATGVILAFSGISLVPGFAILYGVIGLLLCISGAVAFLSLVLKPEAAGE
jgi:hypothetical protein